MTVANRSSGKLSPYSHLVHVLKGTLALWAVSRIVQDRFVRASVIHVLLCVVIV